MQEILKDEKFGLYSTLSTEAIPLWYKVIRCKYTIYLTTDMLLLI